MVNAFPPWLRVICELITADSVAIDPREKSNLPLLRFVERAIVVSITVATPRTNMVKLWLLGNIFTPLAAQMIHSKSPTKDGMISVPIVLLAISFILFEFVVFISFSRKDFKPDRPCDRSGSQRITELDPARKYVCDIK